jgi:pimeloyl-ACP methyl ester carboxylesterase
VPWKAGLRPDWNAIEAIEDSYARVDRECLIIVGMRDEALPASMAYKMAIQLPRSSFVPLKGIMHSPHIEAHERCATLIREFVTTGRVSANVLTPRGEH